MSDFELRLSLIFGAVVIIAVSAAVIRGRASTPERRIRQPGLEAGIHFFSSSSCLECDPVRAGLVELLGASGFVEHRWEKDSELFQRLGIDGVPATLRVDRSGKGVLWPGKPEPIFLR